MANLLIHPVVQNLVAAAIGALGMWLLSLWRNKTTVLTYAVHVERIGISADDAAFGSVRVQWQERPVPNLYLATVTLDNPTLRDVENLHLKAYVSVGTLLLTERCTIDDSPHVVPLDSDYVARVVPPAGATPTAMQIRESNTSREYRVDVLNRGQRVRLAYLCTSEGQGQEAPMIYISGINKGLRFVLSKGALSAFGAPMRAAQGFGLVGAVVIVIAAATYVDSIWLVAGVALVVGLFAQLIGAVFYKTLRWMQNLIAG